MKVAEMYNVPKGSVWQWYDYTNENQKVGYFLSGEGSLWNNNGVFEPFPSSFQELDLPSYGMHIFEFRPINGVFTADFGIHAVVKCYLVSFDGSQQLVNTYDEVYEFGQGNPPTDPNNSDGVSFSMGLSCYTTTSAEGL